MPAIGSSRQIRRTASSSSRAREPARLRRAGAGCVAGVADVDVDGEEDRVALVERDLERLVEAGGEPALADLGHLEGAHVLLGHPAQRLGPGPVAAQPHLQEPVAPQRAATRSAGASAGRGRRASRTRCRRCRRARRSGSSRPCRSRGAGPPPVASGSVIEWSPPSTSGIVPWLATAYTASSRFWRERSCSPGGISTSPASTHPEVLERVDPQREVRPRAVVRQVVGLPDRLRPEPGAGPVRGAAVQRRPDHHDVGRRQRVGVLEVDRVDAEEGDVGAELRAVPSHGPVLPARGRSSCRIGPGSRSG